ncbi:MAG: dihydrodipicolinate synthase family protein [Clostridiales bacterium]|nr:dihydrodipicolinate synthase family protein [Clostridiales bacterium]
MNRHTQAMEILKQGTVIPATPLALNAGRQLDARRQRALMRYYLDAGAGGIATAVHTTQFEIHSPETGLLEPVLSIVSEEIERFEKARGQVIVRVAGVCGGTEQAVTEARLARKYHYDAVLLSPGGLEQLDEEALIARTKAVAAVLPVIGFYLQPSVGGRKFSYNYWEQIVEIPEVAAIKAAPFNRYMTLDVARAVALSSRWEEIALYTGNDDNIVYDLMTEYRFGNRVKRFAGGLLGHWSVWTKKAVEIFELCKRPEVPAPSEAPAPREDLTRLCVLAGEVTDANAAFFDAANGFKGCIAGLHEVLRRQGLLKGLWLLNPQETLSPGQMEEIDRVYAMYPHLNDDAFISENLEKWLNGD